MTPPPIDWDKLAATIEKFKDQKWGLIPLLQEIQAHFGYIPPDTIDPIAEAMNLFPAQVQGVINFYAGFSLEPKGKYVIKVCRGTACHVKGSESLLRLMKRELNVGEGETTPDYRFTLETAACLGACALAPTMMVNKNYFGKVSPAKVSSTLGEYGKPDHEEDTQ
ncbi:MAG: NADH-quinone oxidoreductase subunit NuoE [Desulfobacterales bacterium]|jgi:NADH:ubiquinone oxidoreductase subunit E|nr:NADH-quinone oxidoreductase subunit NuoE [Desulfobacterales bacterium]